MPLANTQAAVARGPVWAAQVFLLSLLFPFYLHVGPILLMPHRIVLLVLFVPFFLQLFVLRRAGPVLAADWLLFGAALWAAAALLANHPFSDAIQPLGINMVEFFGAYLLARVSIRSGDDFRKMVRLFFFIVAFLLPFAAAESLTHRPILLDLLPGTSVAPVDTGSRLGMRRAQTIFAHPILFGVFVSTGLGLFWYALRPRWLRIPAALVAAAATVFSLSSGALLSFVLQGAFIGWETVLKVLRRRWTLFVVLAVLGYVVIDLLSRRTPFHVLVHYATFSSGSAYNRILIWQFGTQNVWAHPLFGLGLNDWARPPWMSGSVDNFWLSLTMKYGLPAIAMILLALALILRGVARAKLMDPDDRLCRAGYLVAIGGITIAGGTVHYWHAMLAFVMFIYGSGLWAATGGGRRVVAPETGTQTGTAASRRPQYTRQPEPGVPIGATAPGPAQRVSFAARRPSRTSA